MNPSRRQVLGGGLGLAAGYLLTGCGGGGGNPQPTPSSGVLQTSRATLTPAVSTAISNERELLGAYDAVVATHPELAELCAVARDHHHAHLQALGAEPSATTYSAAVPADAHAATQILINLENAAAAQRKSGAVSDFENGSLLAAIAAAEAVHGDLLAAALPSSTTLRPPSSSPAATS